MNYFFSLVLEKFFQIREDPFFITTKKTEHTFPNFHGEVKGLKIKQNMSIFITTGTILIRTRKYEGVALLVKRVKLSLLI